MTKPICVKCKRFFRVAQNGVAFVENYPIIPDAVPGIAEPDSWRPYKLWLGDLWKCEGCGQEIIHGSGNSPVSEHYKEDFDRLRNDVFGAKIEVNDC